MNASERLTSLLELRKTKETLIKEAGRKASGAFIQGLHKEQAEFSAEKKHLKAELLKIDQEISSLNSQMKRSIGSSRSIVFMRAFYQEARANLPDQVFQNLKLLADGKVGQR